MSLKRLFLRKIFDRYFRWRLPELLEPQFPIVLNYVDYPLAIPSPRYGFGKPPHPRLHELMDARRAGFADELARLRQYRDFFLKIPIAAQVGSAEPYWSNVYFSDLDAIALYGMLVGRNPSLYVEVGSGNSTRFARRAIRDHSLRTRLLAIDPMPRLEIGGICDEVVKLPFEQIDLSLLNQLDSGDFLFIDNSHLAMANSDVATFFLDVFPRLKPGITLHLHDILLPYDYPPQWSTRYYSEQYLLACYLLAMPETKRPRILLANAFISQDRELDSLAAAICDDTEIGEALKKTQPSRRWSPPHRGLSIWMETK